MHEVVRTGAGLTETVLLRDVEAGTSATVALGYGCNCFSFRVPHRGQELELLYAEPGFPRADLKGTRNGIPILAPFPNRLRGGKFSWGGQDYQLPATDGMGNAIHGFAWDRAWRLLDSSSAGAARMAAEFVLSRDHAEKLALWPGDFRLRLEYSLSGMALRLTGEVENLAAVALPFGFGTHPYFRVPMVPGSTLGDTAVQLHAEDSVELIGCLPTGTTRPVAAPRDLRAGRHLDGPPLDDVYAGLKAAADGRFHSIVADRQAGVRLVQSWDASLPYAVVFMPPHGQAVCVEPYTCVTDALNLAHPIGAHDPGLWRLQPGERRVWRIDLEFVAELSREHGR